MGIRWLQSIITSILIHLQLHSKLMKYWIFSDFVRIFCWNAHQWNNVWQWLQSFSNMFCSSSCSNLWAHFPWNETNVDSKNSQRKEKSSLETFDEAFFEKRKCHWIWIHFIHIDLFGIGSFPLLDSNATISKTAEWNEEWYTDQHQ